MEVATDSNSILDFYMNETWSELDSKEKAVCMNYKRQLLKEMKISKELMFHINDIHDKYPDFHIGCIP